MAYDFDKITERRGTYSLKWDVKDGELPMWVADMDFPTAPAVRRRIEERAAHGVFGYNIVPDEWYDSVTRWWAERHGLKMRRDSLCFCTGVVPAVSCLVKRLTNIGDDVVTLTPVYDIFFHSIENAGRHVVECPLAYDGGAYTLDFARLESALSRPNAALLLLCNPHNPTGNIWSAEELRRIGSMCAARGVPVISDEIHCDLIDPRYEYTPFAAASEECARISVTCVAASKAFNLAGLQSAAVYAENERLFNVAVRGLNSDELAEPNTFAAIATAAAFSEGGEWLDELRAYLAENKRMAREYIGRNIPSVRPVLSRATYLMWLDVGDITDDSRGLADFIRKKTGLYLSEGGQYRGNGNRFLRLNAGCPASVLADGLNRLRLGIDAYSEKAE